MSAPNTLAIDLGTKTGWAIGRSVGAIASGVWNLDDKKFAGAGMRFLVLRQKLVAIHKRLPVDVLYFEGVRAHRGVDAAHVYGGLLATLAAWCETERIPYDAVPVGTIKRYWTGKGNADKAMMIEMAKLHGFNVIDDNEADALALLHYKLTGVG